VSSSTIPHAPIAMTGPLTRADFLAQLYWFADLYAVPEVRGISGLARLTRIALILGVEAGAYREIEPFFSFHRTPAGGVASPDVWKDLLALRAYQVLHTSDSLDPMPAEELEERTFMLETLLPAHERREFPMPSFLERDVLTNKGTFFSAKREDQAIQRRIEILKSVPALADLPLAELNERALPLLREVGAR
jgi:hypothetical protein